MALSSRDPSPPSSASGSPQSACSSAGRSLLVSIFLYLVVFYRAGLFSDALLQVFFVAFTLYGWWHWWRGVRQEGSVRVVPLPRSSLITAVVLGIPGSFVLGTLARHLHAALPYLDAALISYWLVASLVGRPQAHRQLVALDCGGSRLHRRVHLQRPLAHGAALCGSCGARRPRPARLAPRRGELHGPQSLVPSP